MDGWRSPFEQHCALGSSTCPALPDYTTHAHGACPASRTPPSRSTGIMAVSQPRAERTLLPPVGNLNTQPTLCLSQHWGSWYDASATP